jgi:hypothetical protein
MFDATSFAHLRGRIILPSQIGLQPASSNQSLVRQAVSDAGTVEQGVSCGFYFEYLVSFSRSAIELMTVAFVVKNNVDFELARHWPPYQLHRRPLPLLPFRIPWLIRWIST